MNKSEKEIEELAATILNKYEADSCRNTHGYYLDDDVIKAMVEMYKAAQQIGGEESEEDTWLELYEKMDEQARLADALDFGLPMWEEAQTYIIEILKSQFTIKKKAQ